MKTVFAVGSLAALLASCATPSDQPQPNDRIKDPTAAIAIGKVACGNVIGPTIKGRWGAVLNDGSWQVSFQTPGSRGYGPDELVSVRASDGKAGDCSLIVHND